ncbi:HD-GYP domain-containing protein [Shewanella sp. CG12_big_fil_rev_8_21_14_0_65_47_15]|uniref:HD-GYP domain-containing protein n=1 Tax=Shewanella sp. CG12_big_fil_rev_8_21_14_0_65_47_15 TaxID=1975537 RepID=UPI000CBFEC08|nr:HD-GYP domain-containing protein [Shewanella sp. CG12_big_fil_rev_8_21_14_0_65_47_15]PIW58842.1 MAG: phosphohydrolase [Shewanella sp. CG12_big_fil_rev_8_21_14_0_65_47_15]
MAKAEQRKLLLSELQLGMRVKLPLSWTNHPFLFNRVDISSAAQIEMIRGLGVPYVFLISEDLGDVQTLDEEEDIEEVAKAPPERDLKADTRRAMRLSQKRFLEDVNQCRNVFSKIVSDPEGAYRLSAALVEDLLGHLQEVEKPFLTLVGMDEKDVSVTQHGVSVAVLAMMIGHALDLTPRELRDIALGSLFHDIGKLKVPDIIRRKRGALTAHEANYLQMHPNFGYDMLNRSGLFPKEVLHIVLHHHEFIDGSGFPDGLTGHKIPIITQIVSLANDYDQQLSGQQTSSPQVALGYLFKNRSSKHAESLIAVLVKILGIYPPGTIVKLSDDSVAKVIMTTKDVSQPQVWACKEDGSEASLRFLSDEGVTVQKAIKAEELTEGAIRTLQVDKGISFYFSSLQA